MILRLVGAMALVMLGCAGTACGRVPSAPSARLSAGPSATLAGTPWSDGRTTPSPGVVVVYSQPPRPAGGLIPASWHAPGGGDADRFVWENFGFENPQRISQVRWQGGYDPALRGSGGPISGFTIDVYTSIPAGSEPNLAVAPFVHLTVSGNAEETPADVLGGVQTYTYRAALPEPFDVAAATTYWIQIQAFQSGEPDWGLSVGTGTLGDGRHFRGTAYGYYYQLVLDDAAIELAAAVEVGKAPIAEVGASAEDIAAMLASLPPAEQVPVNAEGVQEIVLVVSRSGYTPLHFAVKAGIPVRLTFRQLGYVPGGNELLLRWGEKEQTYLILTSPTDKKVLDFTPQQPGEYRFSCPHDWYEGVMTVQL